jgi:hypothetical protein
VFLQQLACMEQQSSLTYTAKSCEANVARCACDFTVAKSKKEEKKQKGAGFSNSPTYIAALIEPSRT